MLIDFIVAMLLVMAVLKGYRRGLIVGIFSYVAFIVGLAAAMKLSATVASRIGEAGKISDKWMPFLTFFLIFIVVTFLIRYIARLVQTIAEKIMLGWLNRIGGVAFFALLYLSVFAIFLFYLTKLNVLGKESAGSSITYRFIEPLGRLAIDAIGYIIPAFKGLFAQLEGFFETMADKAR